MRIMGKPDIIEAGFLDPLCVAIIGLGRHRVTDIGIFLVPVDAAQEHSFPVDDEPVAVDPDAADPDARFRHIRLTTLPGYPGDQTIEVRRLGRPQSGPFNPHCLEAFFDRSGREAQRTRRPRHFPRARVKDVRDLGFCGSLARIADIRGDLHRCPCRACLWIGDEQAAACHPVGKHFIAEMNRRLHDQPDASV